MQATFHAYIDESGQRGLSLKSSTHFIMSAVILDESQVQDFEEAFAALKVGTRRQPNQELTFKRLNDQHRVFVSSEIGSFEKTTVISVVLCKRSLTDEFQDENRLYLFALRLLLERLSWFGQKHRGVVKYTLSHIIRFKKELLRRYEDILRDSITQIKWQYLDPKGGSLNVPKQVPQLQLADLVASSIGLAFNAPNLEKPTDAVHLENIYPRVWAPSPGKIHSYGLKFFPAPENVKTAYPEVAVLQERCMSYTVTGCPSVTSCRHTST